MKIEIIRSDDKFDSFESFREAYKVLIDQVIVDKLYDTDITTVLRFKENTEIIQEVEFSPSYSWERIMTQVEELPKLCEIVLSTLGAALVFHKYFFKKAEIFKTYYMCMALDEAAFRGIIPSEGSKLTQSYIELTLNKLAEDRGWVFVAAEITDGKFRGEEDKYVKGCGDFNREDLALNLLFDEYLKEEHIRCWWVDLSNRLEENIHSCHISKRLRP